ncbi:MAG: multidrug efflux MFS transporter [Acidimicrobiales bacterium]|nr:multidrug efflux MFS transporter [Acidimicrobiales bacterium]
MEPYVKRVAVVVVLGSIMSILDTTIVNVALASLSRQLHTSLNTVQWVVSAYLLALAAVIPLSGWSVRRWGAYRIYMSALILFTLGSALCALATSATELIAFRAIQGLGGGLLSPTGMTLLVQAAGPRDLPRVMSAIGVPVVTAPVFGPTIGGLLLQSVGWQAIFLINVPIGLVTAFVALRMLPRDTPEPGDRKRLDWPGLILAAFGTVGITYGFSQSATAGKFTSPSVLAPMAAGAGLVVVFVLRSRRVKDALLDLRLYALRTYSSATVVMFCLGGALFGSMILLPMYFQTARGQDAIHTGLLLIPQGIGAALGMNRSARATVRLGAGLTSVAGLLLVILVTLPFLWVGSDTSFVLIGGLMAARGVGVGLAMMPAMSTAFATLDPDQVRDASPQINVIQRIGGSFGTAIVAVVLQSKLLHAATRAGSRHPSPHAVAASFAQTYQWILLMYLLALIPATVLWRVERRLTNEGRELHSDEAAVVEALA